MRLCLLITGLGVGGQTKAIFKRAMEPYLPREVLYRKKMGFGCPVGAWLRTELREMAHDLLLSPAATGRGIFRRAYAERLLAEHMAGSVRHDARLWALLMLELWFRMWGWTSRPRARCCPRRWPRKGAAQEGGPLTRRGPRPYK